MIDEGLAQWYEIEDSGLEQSIISQALSPKQQEQLLDRMRGEFNSTDNKVKDEWLGGSEEKDIPHWAGYTLGYYIVGEYLKKHPGEKASTLYAVPASEFIVS